MVKLIAISDIHIRGNQDPLYRRLLSLMKKVEPQTTFVLNGDIFDLFLGKPKDLMRLYPEFFEELEEMGKKGISIHYIEGNHDFHLKKVFLKQTHCRVYPDECFLSLHEKRFYIAHGDLVDQTDRSYLRLREFLRKPRVQKLIEWLPWQALSWVGMSASQWSRSQKKSARRQRHSNSQQSLSLFREFSKKKIQEGFDFVILGHHHVLDDFPISLENGRDGFYSNIGYPPEDKSYIFWDGRSSTLERKPF